MVIGKKVLVVKRLRMEGQRVIFVTIDMGDEDGGNHLKEPTN